LIWPLRSSVAIAVAPGRALRRRARRRRL